MSLRLIASAVACLALLGCASTTLPAPPAAVLSFADPESPYAAAEFLTLDGEPVPGTPTEMSIPPGEREIGYSCAGIITMDGPTTVTARFESGKTYHLHCEANRSARIVEW